MIICVQEFERRTILQERMCSKKPRSNGFRSLLGEQHLRDLVEIPHPLRGFSTRLVLPACVPTDAARIFDPDGIRGDALTQHVLQSTSDRSDICAHSFAVRALSVSHGSTWSDRVIGHDTAPLAPPQGS
jgi:hypothetical protein